MYYIHECLQFNIKQIVFLYSVHDSSFIGLARNRLGLLEHRTTIESHFMSCITIYTTSVFHCKPLVVRGQWYIDKIKYLSLPV